MAKSLTALAVGEPYPGALPDEDAAVFHLDAHGPLFLLALTGPDEREISAFRRGQVEFGLLESGTVLMWLYRFGERMDGDAPFHAALHPPGSRFDWGQVGAIGQLAVLCLLVDRRTTRVKGIRMVSVSRDFTLILREVCQRQEAEGISRADYDAAVSAAFAKWPTLAAEREAARVLEVAGVI